MAYAVFAPIDAQTVEKKTDNTKPPSSPIRTTYGASSVFGAPVTYAEPLLDFDIWGRAAFLYDCRSLLTTATSLNAALIIQKVEVYRVFSSPPYNADYFELEYRLGTYGSPALVLNQALYNFGTLSASEAGETLDSAAFIDLGALGIANLSLTSYTALNVRNPLNDSHPSGLPNEDGEIIFDSTSALRVTYDMVGPARRKFKVIKRAFIFNAVRRSYLFNAKERVFTFKAAPRKAHTGSARVLTFRAKNRSGDFVA